MQPIWRKFARRSVILHDTLPNDGQHEELWRNAMASLSVWERELTNAVKVRDEVQKEESRD